MRKRYFLASTILLSLLTASNAKGDGGTVRWDIIQFTSFNPPTFAAGGTASSLAEDGSMIYANG